MFRRPLRHRGRRAMRKHARAACRRKRSCAVSPARYFGKIVPLRGRLVIGRGSDCDLVLDEAEMSRRHAVIENSGDGIYLRDLGSANGTFVNGVQVRNAVLHPDDQIAFDQNRFLLEAPGMPSREQAGIISEHDAPNITQTMRAVRLPDDDQPRKAPVNSHAQRHLVADRRGRADRDGHCAAAARKVLEKREEVRSEE